MRSLTKNIKVLVVTILTIIIAFIFLDIFNGQFSFSENQKIENLISEKEKELETIYQNNQDLKEEIKLLKNNEEHIKKIAEEELGLINDDEKEPE